MLENFQELAQATGKTTTEIANMATMFYQQGKNTTDVLKLTEAAAKAATIAGIDGSRSIDLLTNALNGFQMSANDAMEVSDKFAALAASAATDYEELAVALSKVASQANMAGMSMDFTLGMLTKGLEVTREAPETIGTALKTVIARMRELSDYGKTLEDDTDINQVDSALKNVGVSLRDTKGEFRDLDDVLTDLGKKWDTLNKNQQANVAVALAGTRQQSRLIAMMQDFDRTLELVDTSASSHGATLAQQAKYMDGMAAKITLLKNAYEGFVQSLTNNKLIISGIETITKFLEFAADISGVLVPVAIALVGYGAIQLVQKQKIKQLEFEITKYETQQKLIEAEAALQSKKTALEENELKEHKEALNKVAVAQEEKKVALQDEQVKLGKVQNLQAQQLAAIQNGNERRAENLEAQIYAAQLEYETAKATTKQKEEALIIAQQEEKASKAKLDNATNELRQQELLTRQLQVQMQSYMLNIRNIGSFISTLSKLGQSGGWAAIGKTIGGVVKSLGKLLVQAAPVIIAIGGLVLAVKGIEKLIKVFDNLHNPLKKVNEELEQLQVNLYNVSQKKTTISGLADDFEDLANKISLTNEEAEKLEEIVNSVNDTAGFKIITASDMQGQLKQIKAYETSLALEQQSLINEQNETIGKAYKDLSKSSTIGKTTGTGAMIGGGVGIAGGAATGAAIGAAWGSIMPGIGNAIGAAVGALIGGIAVGAAGGAAGAGIGAGVGALQDTETAQQKYAREFANSATGKEALNSIGKQQIEGLIKAGQDTQTAVLQMFRDQFGNLLTEDGVDVDKFTKDMGINSDFIAKLDKVLGEESTLVEKWQYINELQDKGFDKDLLNSLKAANVELAVMSKVSKQTAEYMSNVEGSSDLISEMWQKASKLLSLAGKSSDEISTLLSGALNKAAQDPKNFKKILVEEMSKIYTNEAVIKMSPGEVAALEKQVKEAYDKVQKAIEERSKIKDTNSDEYKDKTKEITELSGAYNELNEKLDGYKNNTENITDATNDLYSIFDGQALSDWGDAIDKLSSKIERLTKITDISALSGADLVQLIRDYPELTDKIMSGNINLSDLVGMIRSGTKTIIEKAQTSYKDAQDAIDTAAITGKITDKQKAFMLSKDAVQFFNQSDKTERELMSELGLDYLNEEDVKQFNLMRNLVNSLNNAEITVSQTLARLGTEETAIEKLFGESVIGLSARYDAVADNIDKIKNAMTLLDEESDEYLERQKQLIEGYGDEVSLTMDKIKEAEEAALKKVDTPEI